MSADDEVLILSESEVDLGDLREGRAGDHLLEATARAVIPKRGKVFDEDGFCKIAVIRPCLSRGARLRGLPPIYTPQMLEANAFVFNNALMYVDHLSESGLAEAEIADLLAEARRARKVDEMGGRVVVEAGKHWDPTFTTPDDDVFGYQPGAVIGKAIPIPRIREMVENDPELLHVSINAYPKSARKGPAPWDPAQVGMIVEGIRAAPNPTVDWVPRGGAGGRVVTPSPVQESAPTAVYLGGHHYSHGDDDVAALPGRNPVPIDLNTLKTPEALREAVAAENPALAESAFGPARTPAVRDGMSRSEIEALLESERTKAADAAKAEVATLRESLDEDLEVREGVTFRSIQFAKLAGTAIDEAKLPKSLREGLEARYGITARGIGSGLLCESEDPGVAWSEVDRRLKQDIADAKAIVAEAQNDTLVSGLGGGRQPARASSRTQGVFRDFLAERAKDGPVDDAAVKTLVMENVD